MQKVLKLNMEKNDKTVDLKKFIQASKEKKMAEAQTAASIASDQIIIFMNENKPEESKLIDYYHFINFEI